MSKRWHYSPLVTLMFMIPLVSFYSFALDLYIPLLPEIQKEMGASRVLMQYTNSLFMLFCGLGQLCFGPLSDRYGRKPILLISCLILVAANITCAFSSQIYTLLLGRILQAIGACGCHLTAFATIRDIFPEEKKSTEMFSYLNISNSLSAIFAPSIGSFLGSFFSWHAIFYAQFTTSFMTFIYCFISFQETSTNKHHKSFGIMQIIQNYLTIFFHVNYQVYTLPAACGMATFFSYYCVSPYLYQEVLGFDTLSFSLLYGTCGITFFIGSYICGLAVARAGILPNLVFGLVLHQLGCIGVLLSFFCFDTLSVVMLHSSVIVLIFGSAFMIGTGIGGTMAPFASMAGAAFAMISCYKFLVADLSGDLVIHFYDGTPLSMGFLCLGFNLLCCLVLFLFHHKLQRAKETKVGKMVRAMDQTGDQIL